MGEGWQQGRAPGEPRVEPVRQQVGRGELLLRHGRGLVEHGGVDVAGHVVVLEVDEGVGGEGRPPEVEGGGPVRLPVLGRLGDGAPRGGRAGRALGGRGVGGALLLGGDLGLRGEEARRHQLTQWQPPTPTQG